MLICFGLSWPMNAYKNYKARTAAGTSWQFILLITLGYFAGIAAKFVSGTINWVLIVYFINVVCIAVNWAVYFRNCKLDAERGVIDAAESSRNAAQAAIGQWRLRKTATSKGFVQQAASNAGAEALSGASVRARTN